MQNAGACWQIDNREPAEIKNIASAIGTLRQPIWVKQDDELLLHPE